MMMIQGSNLQGRGRTGMFRLEQPSMPFPVFIHNPLRWRWMIYLYPSFLTACPYSYHPSIPAVMATVIM